MRAKLKRSLADGVDWKGGGAELAAIGPFDSLFARFNSAGYVVLPRVISQDDVRKLNLEIDGLLARQPDSMAYNLPSAVGLSPLIANLMEYSLPLALIVNHLGYNLQLHSSVLTVRRPVQAQMGENFDANRGRTDGRHVSLNWHRDGPMPQFPRVEAFSAKVCFVLSDMSQSGRGNTRVVPGSHLQPSFKPGRGEPDADFKEMVEICAEPGDAFVFTQNLWHAAAANTSDIERRLVFIGYSAIWARPVDHDGAIPELLADASPVRRQLVGELGSAPVSRYVPSDDWLPLKEFWLGAPPSRTYA